MNMKIRLLLCGKSDSAILKLAEAAGLDLYAEVLFLGGNDESFGAVFGPAQVFDRCIEEVPFAVVSAL